MDCGDTPPRIEEQLEHRINPTPPQPQGGRGMLTVPPPPPHPHLAGLDSRWASGSSLISVSSTDSGRGLNRDRRMSEASAGSDDTQSEDESSVVQINSPRSPDSNSEKRGHKRSRENLTNSFDYVEEPLDRLTCSICIHPFVKPVIVNGCGHEFCEACLFQSLGQKRECPLCRQPVDTTTQFATPLRRVQEEVDHLIVRCPFWDDGCEMTMPRKDMKTHADVCLFAVVECTHSDHGCRWHGSREALAHHLKGCEFEKLKGFTNKTSGELAEARATVKLMEGEVKRLRVFEDVVKLRADRIRQSERHKRGLVDPTTRDKVTVVQVIERGSVQYMFKVKMSTRLGKIMDILHRRRECHVVLTCDGPLSLGGSVIEKDDTLFDLGVVPVEPTTRTPGALLYAETL